MIVQCAVNDMWFQNKYDEGIKYKKNFDPLPIPAIALVLTAVSATQIGCWDRLTQCQD